MKIKNTKAFEIMFLLLPIVLILIAAGSLLLEEITNLNWQTFWMAVEALATVGALIFLGFGLSKLRKEIAASKIEGLKYAREQLESKDFQRWSKLIEETLSEGGNEYPETIDGDIFKAMDRIDFVAELIDLEYVDKALLFYLFADSLFHIDTAITDFEQRENSQISAIRARFPNGYALLKEASKASSEVQSKGVERLKKYVTT